MMNLPLSYISELYLIAEERTKAEHEKQEKEKEKGKDPGLTSTQAMMLEDELEAAMT